MEFETVTPPHRTVRRADHVARTVTVIVLTSIALGTAALLLWLTSQLLAGAPAARPACTVGSEARPWNAVSFDRQSGTFVATASVTVDAKANVGLGLGRTDYAPTPGDPWKDLAAVVLFEVDGAITAYDGDGYVPVGRWAAETTYQVTFSVDVPRRLYAVAVRGAAGEEAVGDANSFRTSIEDVPYLDTARLAVGDRAGARPIEVCDLEVAR